MDLKNKTNVFTEEGRILQIEYAIKNVAKAGTIIGLVCTDGIVLLGIKKNSTSKEYEKIYKIKENTFCAVSGLFSDCQQIVKNSRVFAENSLESYGVYFTTKAIAEGIGKTLQTLTQMGGTRPLGVTVLYAGDGMLVSTDPSGTVMRWNAVCFGENDEFINKEMKNVFVESFDLETATEKILKIVGEATEFNDESVDKIEMLHIKKGENKFVDSQKIREVINKVKTKA